MPPRAADAVRRALETLEEALAPFVLGALKARYGASWWTEGVARRMNAWEIQRIVDNVGARWGTLDDEAKIATLDHRALLALVVKNWIDTFEGRIARPGRSYVEECRFIANRQAHLAGGAPWIADDAFRAVDTIQRLLQVCGDQAGARELDGIRREFVRPEGLPGRVAEATPQPWNVSSAESSSQSQDDAEATSPTVEFPLKATGGFLKARGLEQEWTAIRRAKPKSKQQATPYRRALFVELLEARGLLSDFIDECWPHGGTAHGESLLRRYRERRQRERAAEPASAARTAWDAIADLVGSVDGPEDLAAEHDRYLYRRSPGGRLDAQ